MTRVSENSSNATVQYSLNRTKSKLDDLQKQGVTLKKVSKPSDAPLANIEALQVASATSNNNQFLKNADYALVHLNVTDKSLERISNIIQKTKEVAIAHSSDFYGPHIRKNIANEILQVRNELLSIANRRLGQKYIFAGYKTFSKPFDGEGKYLGDEGQVNIEISKGFFVPININGREVFGTLQGPSPELGRSLASFESGTSLFGKLDSFIGALENDDTEAIQGLLEKFDDDISRIITLRTRIGSIVHSIEQTKNSLESDNISHADRKSKLIDADMAELFSDITKYQSVLRASYQASQSLLNQNLLDFLR